MNKEKLTLVIWGFIIFFLGLIFALSFVHTTTSQARSNQEYQSYKIYSAKELLSFKNSYSTTEKLMFFRVSTYPNNTNGQVFAFKKEDLYKYADILKLQTLNGDLFVVISSTDLEKEELKIKDQITGLEVPLIKYIKTGANYTGISLTDNFCPNFEFNQKAIYHLYDCKDWGCRLAIIH